MEANQDLFNRLFREHYREIWQYAFRLLQNRSLTDEVAQETFLATFRYIDTLTTHPNPVGYMKRTAKNFAIKALIAESKEANCLLHQAPGTSHMEIGLVDILPVNISDEDKLLLTLSVTPGYTNAVIAELLGITPEQCKRRMYNARRRLAKKINVDRELFAPNMD